MEKKKLPAAIDCHRRAIELLPNGAAAYYSLGKALLAAGKVDEGLETMEAACAMRQRRLTGELNLREPDKAPFETRATSEAW